MRITFQFIQYRAEYVFQDFAKGLADIRRKGDLDPLFESEAKGAKSTGE